MPRYKSVPIESPQNRLLLESEREYRSMEGLPREAREKLAERAQQLIDLERQMVQYKVIRHLGARLERAGFERKTTRDSTKSTENKTLYFVDPWEGNSAIIVKRGELPLQEGLNIIVTHSDSPHIRIKPRPARFEWDWEKRFNYPGCRLSGVMRGGGTIHQWMGQQVDVIGYVEEHKQRREISFTGLIVDCAAHIDDREGEEVKEAFDKDEYVEVLTGHKTVNAFLKSQGLSSLDDLACSALYAVPRNSPISVDPAGSGLIFGYGHDDRACTFSAVEAIVGANPKRTSIVWVTDKEEVGDDGSGSIGGIHLDRVLDYLVQLQAQETREGLREDQRRLALYNSCVLIGDVNVASSGHDYAKMDAGSAPILGMGTFISGDDFDISHPRFVRRLRELALTGRSSKKNICFQITGSPYTTEKFVLWIKEPSGKTNLLSRVSQFGWAGIPCASTHGHNEIICMGDEYWTSGLYRRFLESYIKLEE